MGLQENIRARRKRRALSESTIRKENRMFGNSGGNKPQDYKKKSRIKAVIFLVLAVLIVAAMAVEKKSGTAGRETEAAQEISSSYQIPEELILKAQESTQAAISSGKSQESAGTADGGKAVSEDQTDLAVTEDGNYTDKEHVALYIHTYSKLPSNFITKTKAKKQGWDPETGNLQDVLPGMSIGGGEFRNEEKRLPEKEGRTWKECDIDYQGGERGAKRIVYSNDGLIYYTGDHYNTFECLYGDGK